MKKFISSVAVATMILATAACTSSGSSDMDTQSGGSNATAERTERGVPTLPAE
jgi:Flp pilus assembly protein TadD